MLQYMRGAAKNIIVKAFLAVFSLSFVLVGSKQMFQTSPDQREVFTVGNNRFVVADLNKEFNRVYLMARQYSGPDFSIEKARAAGLMDTALNNLIERTLHDQEALRLGLRVDPATALAQLRADPTFNENGVFNKDLFDSFVNSQQFSIDDISKNASRRFLSGLFQNDPLPPHMIVDAVLRAKGKGRVVEVVTLDNATIAGDVQPNDQVARSYYDTHHDKFMAPEYRSLTIAALSLDDLKKTITPTEAEIQAAYDDDRAGVALPERRRLIQAIVSDEAVATALAAKAQGQGDLSKAAKELGVTINQLGLTAKSDLPNALGAVVFSLPDHGITTAVKTEYGWHVVQMLERLEPTKPALAEVKDKIRLYLVDEQAIEAAADIMNKADNELGRAIPLEDIADGLRLRLHKFTALDASGKGEDQAVPAELPHYADLLKTAFAQAAGDVSPIMEDRHGHYYIVRTDDVRAPALRSFEQSRDAVIHAWQMEERNKLTAAEAEKYAQMLRDKKALTNIPLRKGVVTYVSTPIDELGNEDKTLPSGLLPQIKKLGLGEVTLAAADNKNYVLRLARFVAASPEALEKARLTVDDEIRIGFGRAMMAQYVNGLHRRFPVSLDQNIAQSLRAAPVQEEQ